MQAVSGLFSGFGGGGMGMAAAGGGDTISASSALGAARFGTSALSALSGFAMSRYNANALDDEAANERLAARGDYLQAQQKTNAINLSFNKVIGAQLADASAGGIDVGSGSVQEAGRQAEQQRDRVVRTAQSGAQIDANLRTARASMLANSASITRTTGILGGIADIAKAGLGFASIGN